MRSGVFTTSDSRLLLAAPARHFVRGTTFCSGKLCPSKVQFQYVHQTTSGGSLSYSSSLVAPAAAAAVPAAAAAAAAAADETSQEDLRNCAVALAKVADDTKALDISVLHVEPLVSWTSYMVLCTVMSKPQLLAVLSRMEDAAAEFGMEKHNSAGSSQWEVLDFGSIVVHAFTADQREYYNLDDFYALAEEVELPFVGASSTGEASYGSPMYGDAAGSSSAGGLWSKSL